MKNTSLNEKKVYSVHIERYDFDMHKQKNKDNHDKNSHNGKKSYHHGNLAESLLDAVDELATKFGLEAVSLRACAKLVGVSPSSAFRHYTDKRALFTAFATRALYQLCDAMVQAKNTAEEEGKYTFFAVGLSYIEFAINKPAFFRAMWREETIYSNDEHYLSAAKQLSEHLQGGFTDTIEDKDPHSFSAEELLAWSSVHGLAGLFVDGIVAKGATKEQKRAIAQDMLLTLMPALTTVNK